MADNVITPFVGTGTATPTWRTVEKAGKHVIPVLLDLGGTGAEDLATGGVPGRHQAVTAVTAAWTSATALDTVLSLAVTGYGSVVLSFQPSGSITGGVLTFEASDDGGTTWYPIRLVRLEGTDRGDLTYTLTGAAQLWRREIGGLTTIRVRLSTVISGTGTANLRLQASAAAVGRVVLVTQGSPADLNAQVVGELAHDAADSGNPLKVGGRAVSAFPASVASGDRVNALFDLFGRQLVSHIDPAQQVWKQVEYTAAQTGTAIWTPASGKRIAITHLQITTGGTTGGVVTLWFGASADTTFTQGTDQVVFRGEFAPSATSKPGALPPIAVPLFAATADHGLKITTSAGITVYVLVYGYEF